MNAPLRHYAAVHASLTPAPQLDPHALWTDDPRAVALLAQCASSPPRLVTHTLGVEERWTSDHVTYAYEGARAQALASIRSEYGRRAMSVGDINGDYDAFVAWTRQPDVYEAITTAIEAHAGIKPLVAIEVKAVDPTACRIFQLVTAGRALTADEQAEVDAAERAAA